MLGVLFLAFILATEFGRPLDRAVVLAFLGVSSTLIGLPSGWQLVRRNGNGGGGEPRK